MNKTRKIKENKNCPSKEESKGFQIDREKLSDWENWTDEFWKECSEALEDASSGLVDTMEQLLDDWDQWESFLEKALEYSWRWVQFLHAYFDEVLVDSDRWGLDFSDEGFQLYVAKWCDSGRIDASGCYTDYLDYPYQGNEFDDLLDIDPICNWAFTLVLHPELGSKCTSYDKFTGWSACCLLAVHPEFLNSFPLSEIGDPKSRFWRYASDPEQYESAWDALEKARPQFAKFRKAKTGIVVGETVAISLDGQRNWISCSQRVNGRSLKEDCFFC